MSAFEEINELLKKAKISPLPVLIVLRDFTEYARKEGYSEKELKTMSPKYCMTTGHLIGKREHCYQVVYEVWYNKDGGKESGGELEFDKVNMIPTGWVEYMRELKMELKKELKRNE